MTKIQLRRSGGHLGKTLHSSMEIEMDETELVKLLKQVAPLENPLERDAFRYNMVVNERETYPVDMARLKGQLKKILGKMEDELKA